VLTQGTNELCAAIAEQERLAPPSRAGRLRRCESMHRLVLDWWLAEDRSEEDVRAVLALKVWGGEPCKLIDPNTWVAIWRRAGFLNISTGQPGLSAAGHYPRPAARTRVFRAAEPAIVRGLSWTPKRGYAELLRGLSKEPTTDALDDRARTVFDKEVLPREVVSSTGATVHIWSAFVSPGAVLAVLEHGSRSNIEFVVDPELLEDIEQLETDFGAVRDFAVDCQKNIADLPLVAADPEGRIYYKRDDGYHQIVDVPEFVRLARQHGIVLTGPIVDIARDRRSTFHRSPKPCDLCAAKPITPRIYEDDVCWVATARSARFRWSSGANTTRRRRRRCADICTNGSQP
jgi:hypothetical protein